MYCSLIRTIRIPIVFRGLTVLAKPELDQRQQPQLDLTEPRRTAACSCPLRRASIRNPDVNGTSQQPFPVALSVAACPAFLPEKFK